MAIGYLTPKDGDEYARHIDQDATIDGYTPRNNKCFCYPYCYIALTNNTNNEIILKWENFDIIDGATIHPRFMVFENASSNPSYTVFPLSYEGLSNNINYAITYANFPQIPWSYNVFDNWFALHENSILFGFASSTSKALVNMATANFEGAVGETSNLVEQHLALLDKQKQPRNLRGNIDGNFLMYSDNAGIYVNKVVAKAEYIEMIDNYFTRFGYQVNTTQSATITNRVNFDYIQTVECNIQGDIPQEDIDELEAIFNSGVTIWHNINTYGDYNVDNRPRGQH